MTIMTIIITLRLLTLATTQESFDPGARKLSHYDRQCLLWWDTREGHLRDTIISDHNQWPIRGLRYTALSRGRWYNKQFLGCYYYPRPLCSPLWYGSTDGGCCRSHSSYYYQNCDSCSHGSSHLIWTVSFGFIGFSPNRNRPAVATRVWGTSLCVLQAYSFQYFPNNHKNLMYVGIKHNEQFGWGR